MAMKLDRPRMHVDFNEMPSANRVLLSRNDTKLDSDGNTIHLKEGLKVYVYENGPDCDGNDDNLLADGVCTINTFTDWSSKVKWVVLIDAKGIRHQSGLTKL